MIKNIKYLFLTAMVVASCTKAEEYDEVVAAAATTTSDGLPATAGTANFSKYVISTSLIFLILYI